MRGRIRRCRRQSGMVLVAVMWAIAALALLAAALAGAARGEIASLTVFRTQAQAEAIGDAAIQLALIQMKTAEGPPKGYETKEINFDDHPVSVRITPVGGLIDVNAAPEELLRDLFVYGAGLAPDAATTLAQRVIDWRDPDQTPLPFGAEDDAYAAAGVAARPRNEPATVPADLLQVLGMSYEVYARILPMITIESGQAIIDPGSAPPEVLAVLAHGDTGQANSISAALASGNPTADLTAIRGRFTAGRGVSASSKFRLQASVSMPDGRRLVRAWWVDTSSSTMGGPPWKVLRTEAVTGEQDAPSISDETPHA